MCAMHGKSNPRLRALSIFILSELSAASRQRQQSNTARSAIFRLDSQCPTSFARIWGMTVKTGVLEMSGDGEDRARDVCCDAAVNSGQGHQKMSPGGFDPPISGWVVRLYANLFAYTRTFSPILKKLFFFRRCGCQAPVHNGWGANRASKPCFSARIAGQKKADSNSDLN